MNLVNVQLEANGPITQMPEPVLIKRIGFYEDENERCDWVEYRLRSDPSAERAIHRSLHLQLKTGLLAEGAAAIFQ